MTRPWRTCARWSGRDDGRGSRPALLGDCNREKKSMSQRPRSDVGNARHRGSTDDIRSEDRCNTHSRTTGSADTSAATSRECGNHDARPRIQRIALVTMNRVDQAALCYALNACQRMDARLDILTDVRTEETNRAVIEARAETDTPWRIIRIDGKTSYFWPLTLSLCQRSDPIGHHLVGLLHQPFSR